HSFVVGRTDLQLRIQHVTGGETGGTREQIRVLEHLAELAGRLHRSERGEGAFRRDSFELEPPFHVLPRQAGARADQMLDEYASRGIGVAQLELRQEL